MTMMITLENLSSKSQRGGVAIPLPVIDRSWSRAASDATLTGWYTLGPDRAWVSGDDEVHVVASLQPRERITLPMKRSDDQSDSILTLHPWVADSIPSMIPSYEIELASGETISVQGTIPVVEPDSSPSPMRLRLVQRVFVQEVPMTIVARFETWHLSPIVSFQVGMIYGTTSIGQGRDLAVERVSMLSGEWPHVDHRKARGLHPPTWRFSNGRILWEAQIAHRAVWTRAQKIVVRGALLCTAANDPFGQAASADRDCLLARTEGPIRAIASGWGGNFLALGTVCDGDDSGWARAEQLRRRNAFERRETDPTVGSQLAERPWGRPPDSGRTGEQADFGCVKMDHARLDLEQPHPWALHDIEDSIAAWELAPVHNREPNGLPVKAEDHRDCVTYNLVPFDRLSVDMLGWPRPVGWWNGWEPPDSQHASANFAVGHFVLTRDPSLRETLRDMLTMMKMDVGRKREPSPGQGCDSPRGWGRPLHFLCNVAWAATIAKAPELLADSEEMAREIVRRMAVAASLTTLGDSSLPVRVLSDSESKYGFFEPGGGTLVRLVLPWQESIGCIGLLAAWRMWGIPAAQDLLWQVMGTIARFGFYWHDGILLHAYGFRYDPNRPGLPPRGDSWTPVQPNYDVVTDGSCARWTLAAIRGMIREFPAHPEAARAAAIVSAYGPPKDWADSGWWSV